MIKKSLFLLCLYAHLSYSSECLVFDTDTFMADIETPTFEADTLKNSWELYTTNIYLTGMAIQLIEAEKNASQEDVARYQNTLVTWFTKYTVEATGKKPEEVRKPLEEQLLQRKSQLEKAPLKRQPLIPQHLAFLCLVV